MPISIASIVRSTARSTGRGATAGGGFARADPSSSSSRRLSSARAPSMAGGAGSIGPTLSQAPLGVGAGRVRSGDQVHRLVDGPARSAELAFEVRDAVVEDPQIVPGGTRAQGQLLLEVDPERSLGVDVLLSAAQPALPLGDLVAQPVGLGPRLPERVLQPLDLGGQLAGATARALGGQLGAPGAPLLEHVRARLLGALGRRSSTSPIGSGTITPPSWRNVRPGRTGASAAGTEKLMRHVPGAAPLSEGGSGMARNRWRPASVSTTSMAWPRSSGRRRRQRPVTRTVQGPPALGDPLDRLDPDERGGQIGHGRAR